MIFMDTTLQAIEFFQKQQKYSQINLDRAIERGRIVEAGNIQFKLNCYEAAIKALEQSTTTGGQECVTN